MAASMDNFHDDVVFWPQCIRYMIDVVVECDLLRMRWNMPIETILEKGGKQVNITIISLTFSVTVYSRQKCKP